MCFKSLKLNVSYVIVICFNACLQRVTQYSRNYLLLLSLLSLSTLSMHTCIHLVTFEKLFFPKLLI